LPIRRALSWCATRIAETRKGQAKYEKYANIHMKGQKRRRRTNETPKMAGDCEYQRFRI
jgi:hypothetical protein